MDAKSLADATRVAAIRLAVLLLLLAAAFRADVVVIIRSAYDFSDWSHIFAIPIIVPAYLSCRLPDAARDDRAPSGWGVLVVAGGLSIWCAVVGLGMFGFARIVALWVVACGVILLAAGRGVFRACVPLMLMLLTCLPLFERSMDRFTIPIQGLSIRAAAAAADVLVADDVAADGREIVRHHGNSETRVGAGEMRFGFRMVQACALVALFVAFSRRRPVWQLFLLAMAFVPVLLGINVMRIVVWTMSAWARGNSIVDSAPRNISAATAVVATYLVFVLLVWGLDRVARLGSLFYVEEDDTEESAESSGDATIEAGVK